MTYSDIYIYIYTYIYIYRSISNLIRNVFGCNKVLTHFLVPMIQYKVYTARCKSLLQRLPTTTTTHERCWCGQRANFLHCNPSNETINIWNWMNILHGSYFHRYHGIYTALYMTVPRVNIFYPRLVSSESSLLVSFRWQWLNISFLYYKRTCAKLYRYAYCDVLIVHYSMECLLRMYLWNNFRWLMTYW